MNRFAKAQAGVGAALVLLGATVMAGWRLRNAALVRLFPDSVGMVFSAALCFALIGAALLLPLIKPGRARIIQTGAGLGVLAIALVALAGNLADADFGVDLPSFHGWLDDGHPRPGRMALAACIGFALAGLALASMQRVSGKACGMMVRIASLSVFGLGLACALGYGFDLDLLYSRFHSSSLPLHSALAMAAAGVGLSLCWHQAEWHRSGRYFSEDEKARFMTTAALATAALTACIAAFSAQQKALDKTAGDNMAALLNSRIALFHDAFQYSLASTGSLAARPDLVGLMRILRDDPDNEDVLVELHETGNAILRTPDVTGIGIYDANQREIVEFGRIAEKPETVARLPGADPAVLFWNGALYINRQFKIVDRERTVGYLVVEQSLPLLTQQMAKLEGVGRTGETEVCAAAAERLLCLPQQRHAEVYRMARHGPGGESVAMSDAIAGRSGRFKGQDARGRDVIAVYGPVGASGLGMVLKQDSGELYRPIRRQMELAAPLLLLFVMLGAWLMGFPARPPRGAELQQANDLLRRELAERKQAEDALKQAQDNLRQLAAHQDAVEEEQRRRIAREIHDGLGGALTGIRSYLSFMVEEARRSAARASPHLLEARNLADSAIATVRRVGGELRPSVLDQLGLWAALEWHAEQMERSAGLKCALSFDAQASQLSLDPERSTALFRIVQETLAGVARRGKASCVTLRATCENDVLVLELKDDGAQDQAHTLAESDLLGIAGMSERARHFAGDLEITGAIGAGALVVLRMPVGATQSAPVHSINSP